MATTKMTRKVKKPETALERRIEERGLTMREVSKRSGLNITRIKNAANGKAVLKKSEAVALYLAIEGREGLDELKGNK